MNKVNTVEFGDCRRIMSDWIWDGMKVQTCVTSPPYFGLRDYGVDGQMGLEQTPDEYVKNMVEVFRLVKDLLADDGTLWLNLGDSYFSTTKGSGGSNPETSKKQAWKGSENGQAFSPIKLSSGSSGVKPKDLIGIPWRVAFALQADGWYLRQDIIWHKPNPMPESVTDRCTKSHEYIFLLTKQPKYFFDAKSVEENSVQPERKRKDKLGGNKGDETHHSPGGVFTGGEKRNRRDVWTVASKPYKGAHFACFPPELIEPCILAGTSESGHCFNCGSRLVRQLEKTAMVINRSERTHELGQTRSSGTMVSPATSKTIGWKKGCNCDTEIVPDIVFDPFMGSGTTAQVALKHGRNYLGCELNPAYKELQDKRIASIKSKE